MPTIVISEDTAGAKLYTTPDSNPLQAITVGVGSSSSGGSGITTLNGLTDAVQTFSDVDDTNVTLDITSSGDDHEFALGWTGELSLLRGGTGAANAAGARSNLGLGTLATQNGTFADAMLRANNLSDLADTTTARSNLGLGALAILSTVGTAQIDNDAVTFAKLQNLTDARLVGRSAGSSGDAQEITVGSGLSLLGGTLTATGGGGSVTTFSFTDANGVDGTVTNPGTAPNLTIALTDITPNSVAAVGAVTGSNLSGTNTGNVTLAGENYLSLAGQQITAADINLATHVTGSLALTSIASIADATILGNNTGGASAPTALTAAQTKSLLSLNNVENTALSTWAGSGNITTVGTVGTGTWNADIITLAKGGTGVALADPGADRVLFWDDSAGQLTWLTMGANLTITDTTLDASGGGTPGGADTQVQYNNGGAFGGMSLLAWDDGANTLALGTYTGTGDAFTITASNGTSGTGLRINTSGGIQSGVHVIGGNSSMPAAYRAGTTGGRIIYGQIDDAGTTNAVESISLYHNTSGTPAAGFGIRQAWYAETTTTPDTPIVYTDAILAVATHASRQGAYVVATALAGTPSEAIRIYRNTVTQTCSVISSLNNGGGLALDVGTAGAFMLDVPNGSTSGGNARGVGSSDLQMLGRNAATEVASGQGAFACGAQNTASQDYTVVSGRNNIADRYHVRAHGGGGLGSTAGAAQYGDVSWCRQTTDGTANLEMFLNGNSASARFTLANNSTVAFEIHVMARRTNGDVENAHYKFEGEIKRDANAASTALVGAVTKTLISEDTTAWDAQVTADTTNGSLKIDVTGEAGKNINWVASGYFTETRE